MDDRRTTTMTITRKKKKKFLKAVDHSKFKPLTDDDAGFDSPWLREMRATPFFQAERVFYVEPDLSHLGSKVGDRYKSSKELYKLTRKEIAIRNHLKTLNLDQHWKKLLVSVINVIYIVKRYHLDIKDLPFDWIRKKFLPEDMRGAKISYPEGDSRVMLLAETPTLVYDKSDDEECETVNGHETEPLKDPNFSRLDILSLATTEHLTSRRLGDLQEMMARGLLARQHFSNAIDKKIWLEFKEFDEGTCDAEVTEPVSLDKKSIRVDHPIASGVGNFAVAAFNNACEKKGEPNNLHDFEVMECKYLKAYGYYHFYMIIEAIEEGNSGTYMAEVTSSSDDGASILIKLVLTDFKPSGKKAMAASHLSCLQSIRKTMDELYDEKVYRLADIYNNLKGPEKWTAKAEIYRLAKLLTVISKGFLKRLDRDTQYFLPEYKRATNPDGWSDPHICFRKCSSGMVPRSKDTTCIGYDYVSPHLDRLRLHVTRKKES